MGARSGFALTNAREQSFLCALRIAPRPADRFADGVYEIRGIDAENLDAALAATVQGLAPSSYVAAEADCLWRYLADVRLLIA